MDRLLGDHVATSTLVFVGGLGGAAVQRSRSTRGGPVPTSRRIAGPGHGRVISAGRGPPVGIVDDDRSDGGHGRRADHGGRQGRAASATASVTRWGSHAWRRMIGSSIRPFVAPVSAHQLATVARPMTPAPAVLLVRSSTRMNEPVWRLSW